MQMNDHQKRLSTKIEELQRNLTLKSQQLFNLELRHEKNQNDLKESDMRFYTTIRPQADKATEIDSNFMGTPVEVAVQTNESIAAYVDQEITPRTQNSETIAEI